MKWLRSFLAVHQLSIARRRAVKVIQRSQRLDKRLAKRQRQLKHLAETIAEDLDEAVELNKDRDQALKMLEEENEVLRDVVVPEITAANETATARWETELSMQKYKQAASLPGRAEH